MSDAAAILATFVKLEAIGTRKIARLSFEVPIEEANRVLSALGGYPDPANPKWVGIALVDGEHVKPREGEAKPKSYAKEAAILCADKRFQKFLQEECLVWWRPLRADNPNADDDDLSAEVVRQWCGVTTRADLLPGGTGGEAWRDLVARYEAWKTL